MQGVFEILDGDLIVLFESLVVVLQPMIEEVHCGFLALARDQNPDANRGLLSRIDLFFAGAIRQVTNMVPLNRMHAGLDSGQP